MVFSGQVAIKQMVITVLFLVFGVFVPAQAYAQISVNGIIRDMLPNKRPIENVEVSNYSENRILQVTMSVLEEIRHEDGSTSLKETDDFLLAPPSMVLRAGEKKQARLVMRKPHSEEERYYRAQFKPSTPDPIRMKALELTEAEQAEQDAIKGGITMLAGVGMFITVAPKDPQPKLTWERSQKGILFKNEGNTTIELRPRKNYCPSDDVCIDLPQKRIFPGEEFFFEFSSNEALVYYYMAYNKSNKAIIGGIE